MIVTISQSEEMQAKIASDAELLGRGVRRAMGEAMKTATITAGEEVRRQLIAGELGLTMQHPGSGLAASVMGWIVDENAPEGAVGVPANSPAIGYAFQLEYGGTITPKKAKALAIPISDEARRYTSPRDMEDLVLISRKDESKPPLLVRMLKRAGKGGRTFVPHWVLLKSVTQEGKHWLSRGVANATDAVIDGFTSRFWEAIAESGSH